MRNKMKGIERPTLLILMFGMLTMMLFIGSVNAHVDFTVNPKRVPLGGTVRITVHLRDEEGQPWKIEITDLNVTDPNGTVDVKLGGGVGATLFPCVPYVWDYKCKGIGGKYTVRLDYLAYYYESPERVEYVTGTEYFYEGEGVGGIWVPVDKFGLLAPYIGLASTIMIGAVATVVYVKRVKRRKEKQ